MNYSKINVYVKLVNLYKHRNPEQNSYTCYTFQLSQEKSSMKYFLIDGFMNKYFVQSL